MEDEVITIEITKHNNGIFAGAFSLDYGEMYPTLTDKGNILANLKHIIEEEFDVELED